MKLDELRPGDPLEGTVESIELAGAMVDVGLDSPGFLHISQLGGERVNRIEDVLSTGQQLEAWVKSVDADHGRLELTLVRPVSLKWNAIKPGLKITGPVKRLEKFGAFVDIGAERDGLVHVSEMSDDYVRDPAEVVKVGDSVEVVVLDVDRKKRQIRLSMNVEEELDDALEDEEQEELPTAMEIALRKAMEQPDNSGSTEASDGSADGGRAEQEDLLSRTLASRLKTSAEDEG